MLLEEEEQKRENTDSEEKLFNFRPIFFSALFLCFGILFCYFYKIYGISMLWLLSLLPLLGLPFCFCKGGKQLRLRLWAAALLGVSFFVGFFGFFGQLSRFSDCKSYSSEVTVTGTVAEKERAGYVAKLLLTDLHIDKNKESGTLVAYLPLSYFEEISLSDVILLEGEISSDGENYKENDFSAYAVAKDVRYTLLSVESCIRVDREFDLFALARTRIEKVLYRGMSEEGASVTMALLLGNVSGIEEELYENVRKGGVAHIFAVSGLHVGALFSFCMILIKKTSLRQTAKPLRFIFVAALLFPYALLCGFSASVVRATVLCLVGYGAKLLKTRVDSLQAVGFAAILILLRSPVSLFEVGFQLSFAACLGIFLLARPFRRSLEWVVERLMRVLPQKRSEAQIAALESGDTLPPTVVERLCRGAATFLSVSFAAQVGTAPILLYSFGYVSSWALLLNCLFVPFVGLVFSGILLLTLIACLLPLAVSPAILYLPNVVWSAALLLFESVDFSSFAVKGLEISMGACVLYYLTCTFLSDKWNVKKVWRISLFFICFLGFIATMVALNV